MLFKGMSLISDHHGVQVSVSNSVDIADANDVPYLLGWSADFFPSFSGCPFGPLFTGIKIRIRSKSLCWVFMRVIGWNFRSAVPPKKEKKSYENSYITLARQTVSLEFLLCPNCERCGELLWKHQRVSVNARKLVWYRREGLGMVLQLVGII